MKLIAALILTCSVASAQEVQILDEKIIEKRFVMDPQPITYNKKELLQFLNALQFEWKILQIGSSGSTIGLCPKLFNGEVCIVAPTELRDQFLSLFVKS